MPRVDCDIQWDRVLEALVALTQRTNEYRYVIFENSATGKFVQFVDNIDTGLHLDLPEQTLDKRELCKAAVYFARYGIGMECFPRYSGPDCTVITGIQNSFNMKLDDNATLATRIVFDIFREVYGYEDQFELRIDSY